ncbi:MAG TPA: SLBB domain-containing protein [Bacteroidota bacterium]|nr:SLBB domain-containing protein [Bacteroidota bacterium]
MIKATSKEIARGLCLFLVLLLLAPRGWSQDQSREQIRTEAESQLQKMTPEEIDQKLKELGITRDEAIAKAKEYGISLEDYLSRLRPAAAQTAGDAGFGTRANPLLGDPRLEARTPAYRFLGDLDTATLRMFRPVKRSPVPGFAHRYGVDSLIQPYGYDIFQFPSTFFTPSAAAPPPPSYELGPNDEVTITLWGETRLSYQLTVNKEGNLLVPDVGPVSANGITLAQFQDRLLKRMSSVYSSLLGGAHARTFLDVSLGKLRTIQVFVTGEVNRPGGYALPSMSTVMTALYVAGGPTLSGSMRNLSIMRRGGDVAKADLYSYLREMKRTNDVPLMDGDVLFVPQATRRAAIVGRVVRPAVYEIRDGETLGDLVQLAGGLRFDAYTRRVHIERIVPFSERTASEQNLLQIDLNFPMPDGLITSREKLEDGDVVSVFELSLESRNLVDIVGPVYKPGRYALEPNMHVADLVRKADSLKRSTFAELGTISRLLPNLRREIISFNLRNALADDPSSNLSLQNEDSVFVYPDSIFFPQKMVTIAGAVRFPGKYPRRENIRISDLIVMAGGLTELGQVTGIEVARMDTSEVGRYSYVFKVDLPQEYWKGGESDSTLQDYDIVSIPENPKLSVPRSVIITGYVMYPGTYAIRYSGERIADVMKRAGGLRVGAYLEGTRLFRKFNNAGLVPIDFRRALDDESSRDNITLYDRDSISVAVMEDVVYVTGEVIVPSPVLYKQGAGLNYYIEQAGGTKQEADEDRIVVLQPGGKKWNGGGLFGGEDILPGSSVYVPKKIEKEDKTLPILRDVVTILASLAALTVAMIQVTK